MALSDKVQKLDEQIAAAVRRTVDGLREDLSQRLHDSSQALQDRLDHLADELPGSFLSHEEMDGLAEEARLGGRSGALTELREAVAALDQAGSQAEILGALLEQGGRFASRTALFLVRDGLAVGWGGYGFADSEQAIKGLQLELTEGTPWGGLDSGSSSLSATECASLCSRLESSVPHDGVIVPMILRDRLAAVLYADRAKVAGRLEMEALQLLVNSAGQQIETLAFRKRPSTPTLHFSTAAAEEMAAPPAATEVAPPPQIEQAEQEEAVEEVSVDSDELLAMATEDVVAEDVVAEDVVAEDVVAEDVTASADEEEDLDFGQLGAEQAGFELGLAEDDEAAEESAVPEPPTPEPATGGDALTFDAQLGGPDLTVDEAADEPTPSAFESPAQPQEEPAEPPALTLGSAEEITLDPAGQEETVIQPSPTLDQGEPPQVQLGVGDADVSEDETVLLSAPSYDQPAADQGLGAPTIETGMVAPPAGGEAIDGGAATTAFPQPPPSTQVTPPPSTQVTPPDERSEDAQVSPPTDIDGPGRAFDGGEGAEHEEARRMARLLVNEIELYNQEQVEEGRRNGDIYLRLREDIDRSRKMYQDRIDPSVDRDYFQEALVRILGKGDAAALGN